ncbi:hypothetical protein Peur_056199 [Populus x canadensis]
MVGLSIVLETPKSGSALQVINKVTMMINNKPSSPPSLSSSRNHSPRFSFPVPTFLDQCFFCGQKLSPGKDIYMYKGDRGFCSVECRCRQIFLDEEETLRKENCSFAAMKPTGASASASASAKSTSSTAASRHRRGTRNREGGSAY